MKLKNIRRHGDFGKGSFDASVDIECETGTIRNVKIKLDGQWHPIMRLPSLGKDLSKDFKRSVQAEVQRVFGKAAQEFKRKRLAEMEKEQRIAHLRAGKRATD